MFIQTCIIDKSRKLLIGMLALLFIGACYAQSPPPRFKKFSIGNSGCFLHFPNESIEVLSDTLDDAIQYYASGSLDKYTFQSEVLRLNRPLFAPEPEYDPEDTTFTKIEMPNPTDSLALIWKEKWASKYRLVSNGEWQPIKHPGIREANGWQETWSSEDGKIQAQVQIWAHPAAIIFLMISGKTLFEDEIVQGIFFRNIVIPKVYRE